MKTVIKITALLLALALLLAVILSSFPPEAKTIRLGDMTYTRVSFLGVRLVMQDSPQSGLQIALASDFGGIDSSGLFVCPAEWNQFPFETGSRFRFLVPVWARLPVADC